MTRDEARARIQQALGFRSDRASEIVTALQDAQVELEKGAELPWFLLTEVASETTVKDEERVALPSDFIRNWEEDALYFFVAGTGGADDSWTPLPKEDLEFLHQKYPGGGEPVAYAQDALYDRIFPTPDAVYTLKRIYYATDTKLTSNVTNNWLTHYPYLMIGEAGEFMAPGFRDADGVNIFQRWSERSLLRMIRDNEARLHTGRRYVMGGND